MDLDFIPIGSYVPKRSLFKYKKNPNPKKSPRIDTLHWKTFRSTEASAIKSSLHEKRIDPLFFPILDPSDEINF